MTQRNIAFPPFVAVLAASALWLPGCPLSDDYEIVKSETSNGGNEGAGGNGQVDMTAKGGASGSSSSATSTASGGNATDCVDIDLATDQSNCGSCGHVCPEGQSCSESACHGWGSIAVPSGFVARSAAAYTVMDGKLFVFGGRNSSGAVLGDGAIYDPTTDSWTLISTTDAPSARQLASAVWTGDAVYVIGGTDASSSAALSDAYSYDLSSDSWTTLPSIDTGRIAPYLATVSSTSSVLVVGGYDENGDAVAGAVHRELDEDNWDSCGSLCYYYYYVQYCDQGLSEPTWVDTGEGAYLFGGSWTDGGASLWAYQYDSASSGWTTLTTCTASGCSGPSVRSGAFGAWDGVSFIVWGGNSGSGVLANGMTYKGGSWSTLSTASAPSAREAEHRRTGWALPIAEGDVAFLGGLNTSGTVLTDGARYVDGSWQSLADWPSGSTHEYGVVVAIGGELFLWGGLEDSTATATGDRWAP